MKRTRLRRLLPTTLVYLATGAALSLALAAVLAATSDPLRGPLATAESFSPDTENKWSVWRWDRLGATCVVSARDANLPYGATQACGPADSPLGSDVATAWATQLADANGEWLELTFAQAAVPAKLRVHENLSPGAVSRVTVFTADGTEVEAWRRKGPAPRMKGGIANIILSVAPPAPFPTRRVKLYLDSAGVPGWNEIDAVELIDDGGNAQWASGAAASSVWNRPAATSTTPPPGSLVPRYGALGRPTAALASLATRQEKRCVVGYGWPLPVLYGESDLAPPAPAAGGTVGTAPTAAWTPSLSGGLGSGLVITGGGGPQPPRNYIQLNSPSSGVFLTGLTPAPTPPAVPKLGPGGTPLPQPRRIYWAGLLVNALLFTAAIVAWRLLVRLPGRFVREVSRMRDGRCIACGYDLGYDFTRGCPECGWRRSGGTKEQGTSSGLHSPPPPQDARAA